MIVTQNLVVLTSFYMQLMVGDDIEKPENNKYIV